MLCFFKYYLHVPFFEEDKRCLLREQITDSGFTRHFKCHIDLMIGMNVKYDKFVLFSEL